MLDQSFLKSITGISWFSRCGEPVAFDIPFQIQSVSTWQAAMEACSKPEWENATLEARNQLTAFLHQHELPRYRDWNKITVAAKQQCVLPLTESVWLPFSKNHELGIRFVHCVQWDVLAAIMEHEYRDHPKMPLFFLHLLSLYRAGHFPCGWKGGEYPDGKLLVL